jgi:16S rRNA (cytosine1402-N4)-methyltransferase
VKQHESVLVQEIIALFNPLPGELYVDGTCGSGGHAEAILEKTEGKAYLIGIDKDKKAIERTQKRLDRFTGSFTLVRESYEQIAEIVQKIDKGKAQGVLLDLGFSLEQISEPQRGFSFMTEGFLDMRYDLEAPVTAADLLNSSSAKELEEIFEIYGEIPRARKIVKEIVMRRKRNPFRTTNDFVAFITARLPRKGKIHPATLFFQALRIAVNNELETIEKGVQEACKILAPNGILAVISFHSLEDRIVKHFFRSRTDIRIITKKPLVPSREEVSSNPRARSAKLRAGEML